MTLYRAVGRAGADRPDRGGARDAPPRSGGQGTAWGQFRRLPPLPTPDRMSSDREAMAPGPWSVWTRPPFASMASGASGGAVTATSPGLTLHR